MKSNNLVSPEWLMNNLENPSIRILEFNWNGTDSYDSWHIPGAQGWYWKDWLWDENIRDFPTQDDFARRCSLSGIENKTKIVCYGDPPQFGTYGWWVIKFLGHMDVCVLDGGRVKWEKMGFPKSLELPKITGANYLPNSNRNNNMRIRRDEILDKIEEIDQEKIILLDHRSAEEYRGERVNMLGVPDVGAERAGRIPGGRHLYFENLLDKNMCFKSADELSSLFEAKGATADSEIISYCRLSHRATLAFFAMTELLGYKNVRSYDGSWTEWGSLVGVPIER